MVEIANELIRSMPVVSALVLPSMNTPVAEGKVEDGVMTTPNSLNSKGRASPVKATADSRRASCATEVYVKIMVFE